MSYTPEQTKEIVDRILELRSYWRRVVEAKTNNKNSASEPQQEAAPRR